MTETYMTEWSFLTTSSFAASESSEPLQRPTFAEGSATPNGVSFV